MQRSATIPAPAPAVWELVSDADQFHRTATAQHLWTFVVPGTPAGQLGEQRVTLTRSTGGHVTGSLLERTAMVTGRLLVNRFLTLDLATTTLVDPIDDYSCQVTLRAQSTVPTDGSLPRLADRLDARLARLAAVATGQALPPSPAAEVPMDTSAWTTHRVTTTGAIWAPPPSTWRAVRCTGGAPHWVGDALLATVPGSPEGEVGELICLVNARGPSVGVQEVVAQEAERLLVVRHASWPVTATRTVTLAPGTFGTDVSIEIEFRVPPATDPAASAERFRRAAEAFLQDYQRMTAA